MEQIDLEQYIKNNLFTYFVIGDARKTLTFCYGLEFQNSNRNE